MCIMFIIWLTCKYRHPSSGETPQEKWSSRLKDWKWFQLNLKIPSLITDGINWLILINSKSFDNHYSLPSREEAPVGIGLSLLFHETLSVISSWGWSDSCFDVFGEGILLQNSDCAAFELFFLSKCILINLWHWETLCHFAGKGCFVPWRHSHLWKREINVHRENQELKNAKRDKEK